MSGLRRAFEGLTHGNPVYRWALRQGSVPERFALTCPDPWPGDTEAGEALVRHEPTFPFEPGFCAPSSLSHAWLRDLRALGTPAARAAARGLLSVWMDANRDRWTPAVWSAPVLGERLAQWVGFYDFYAPGSDAAFRESLVRSFAEQFHHLRRTASARLVGAEAFAVLKGLVAGALAMGEGAADLARVSALLTERLEAEILPDGGHISRSPSEHLDVLGHLLDLRAVLKAARLMPPHALATAIERMGPALKLYRHGDGRLALFHGGHAGDARRIETALGLVGTRGRVLRRLPATGYERLALGRGLVLVDVGPPPPPPFDARAHAGLLAFEFSVGKERLLVNCGAPFPVRADETDGEDLSTATDRAWRQASAATAAHTTLVVEDTNACRVKADGGLARRPTHVTAQRHEQAGIPTVEVEHDGYQRAYRLIHHRVLRLRAEGEELAGQDNLRGPAGRSFALRWHLPPGAQAALVSDGQAALIRAASGAGWRLEVSTESPVRLALEPSVGCGTGSPRHALQIKAIGVTRPLVTDVTWRLTRVRGR